MVEFTKEDSVDSLSFEESGVRSIEQDVILAIQDIDLDLSIARERELVVVVGNSIIAFEATDFDSVADVRIEVSTADPIAFRQGVAYGAQANFSRIYVSNAAQPGKTMKLKVGGPGVLTLRLPTNKSDVSGSSVSISNAPDINDILTPIDVQGITDPVTVDDITTPIETNIVSAGETAIASIAVGVASTLLRTVPANTVERVLVHNNGANTIFLGWGAAAVLTGFPLLIGERVELVLSGGGAGLSLNGIVAAATENARVWALPIG